MSITPAQLATRYGLLRLAQAATPLHRPTVDAELLGAVINAADVSAWNSDQINDANQALDVINAACADAVEEAASYVLMRAPAVPLPAPSVLTLWQSRIAWYRLHIDLRINTPQSDGGQHPVHRDYDDTIKSLRDYRDGKQGLGIAQDPNVPPANASPEWHSQGTVWNRR